MTDGATQAKGSYTITAKPGKKGGYAYRVVRFAAAGKRTAHSPSVTVTVTKSSVPLLHAEGMQQIFETEVDASKRSLHHNDSHPHASRATGDVAGS